MNSSRLTCIVEDQADYRFLLQKLFTINFPDYPVRLFPNGKALLEELPQINPMPALVLMDRHMPELDGYQTLLRLKKDPLHQSIPVVMMSAQATPAEIKDCYQAGANSFLKKQIDFSLLMETISRTGQYWLELNQGF